MLSSPWHRGTRCLQHASALLFCLTMALHCMVFLIKFYVPELLSDEYDSLTSNSSDFKEYTMQLALHHTGQNHIAEDPQSPVQFRPKFPFLTGRKTIKGWRNAILDFLGGMLWLTHNQVTVDTKRTQFPSGRH